MTKARNENGIYALKLYTLGVPMVVIVDDYLPFDKYAKTPATRYMTLSKDKSLWGPILEKAYAKLLGNYEFLDGGDNIDAYNTLTGSPAWYISHKLSDDKLWNSIKASLNKNYMLIAGSSEEKTDRDTNRLGVSYNHVWAILGTVELSNGKRLIKLSNPWGVEYYKGPYSDRSSSWTQNLKEQADHVSKNDGIFYLPVETYRKNFSETAYAIDTTDMYLNYFMAFDNPKGKSVKVDGLTFDEHVFDLKSDVDQTLFISAHGYSAHFLRKNCLKDRFDSDTFIYINIPEIEDEFKEVENMYHYKAYQIKAGDTLDITVHTKFDRNEVLDKDWSVVVWGSKKKVMLENKNGLQS